jgi:SagB-type dehydrogenase family enzyme
MSNSRLHLPPPSEPGRLSVEAAIAARRSVRHFAPGGISLPQLSQLVWAAQGANNAQSELRTAPSAGASYPLEVFVVSGANGVEGLSEGIYHYNSANHSLSRHYAGDVRHELARAASNQMCIAQAPLSLVIGALYERTARIYGERGERYVHMEVGHVGQNIYLQAVALGLATVAIGAFDDELVSRALRLDESLKPLYIMPVGRPA